MRYPYEVGQRLERPDPPSKTDKRVESAAQRSADSVGSEVASGTIATLQGQVLGARALGSLYRAVLLRPGLNAPRDVFAQAFDTVKSLYQNAMDRICQMTQSVESHASLRVSLSGPVAMLIADVWELSEPAASPKVQSHEIEHLLELYAQQAVGLQIGASAGADSGPISSRPDHLAESVAEYRAVCTAMLGLLQVWALRPATQRLYLSDQRPQDVAARIRLTLTDSAAEITEALMPDATDLEQAPAYASVLESLGELYRFTLESQFIELSRRIRVMDSAQKRAYLEDIPQHPGGLLIEYTDELFMTVAPGCYALLESSAGPRKAASHEPELQEASLPPTVGVSSRASTLRALHGQRAENGFEYPDGVQ